jgi:opacity protein-like surface antigen
MKKTLSLLALAAATAVAAPAHAQLPNVTPFSFEVRGGLAFPTGDFGEDSGDDSGDVENGYSLGASATFHLMPMLGIYGGYSYSNFGIEGVENAELVDQGFSAGVRLAIPTPLIPIDPFVRAGAVYHQFEFSGEENGIELGIKSDRALGFEVGAGVGVALGPKLMLTPQVTYTKYSPDFTDLDGDAAEDFDVEHIRVEVGLRLRL